MEKRPAQFQSPISSRRRPIHKMFNGGGQSDFYSNEPVKRAQASWSPGIARGFGPPIGSPLYGGRASPPEAFQRIEQFHRAQEGPMATAWPAQAPRGGAGSGYGMSHDPSFGSEHHPLFNEEQGQDMSFQAMQQSGNPWFDTHQQVTRFAENFGHVNGIRRQRIDQQRATNNLDF